MPQGRVTAHVKTDIEQTKALMLAVYRESAQRTIEYAQTPVAKGGNMPVVTGFLRASGQAALNGALPPLRARPDDPDARYHWDAGPVSLVIASAGLEDRITFAYAANYAAPQEYGARGRAGRRFIGLAAQRWPQTVAEVAREAEARLKGGGGGSFTPLNPG